MKKLLLVTAITTATLMPSFSSQASNIAQSLCEYVSVDDKKRLRSFLKTNKLKVRSVFDNVKCNG